MARRVVNGNTHSEDGWPLVDQDSCTWAEVVTGVWLQIQNGAPLRVLTAFARDFDVNVERLRDADSACWTASNDVLGQPGRNNGSNHLGGTGMDLNWNGSDGRTFRLGISKERAYPGDKAHELDKLLEFYEGMIFCGGEWSIRDWMHFQMGGGTYDQKADRPTPKTTDFIARKIRADGFSTYKRGGSGASLPLSKKDGYALAVINEGKRLGITPKGLKIAIAVTLVETNLTMYANRNVPASLGFPHDAVGADHDSTGLFQQRQAWGPLSETMDPTLSARLFFNGGHAGQRGLTDFDYNSNARTPGGWAQAVQVSAFPTRYDERFPEAEQIYNRLSTIEEDDELADPAVVKKINELHAALLSRKESRSIYADPAEGARWPWYELLENSDKFDHETYVENEAKAGNLIELARVVRTAQGQGKYRDPVVVQKAQRVIAEIEATNPAILQQYLAQKGVSA